MKRNFECLNCHHQFEAEDDKDVTCPQCNSDNVRPVGKKTGTKLIYAGIFAVALILSFIVVKSLRPSEGGTDPIGEETTTGSSTVQNSSDLTDSEPQDVEGIEPGEGDKLPPIDEQKKKVEDEAKKVKVNQPVTLAITTPKANSNGNYSFTARAEHLPTGVTVKNFMLRKVGGTETVASSSNGKFQNVPYSIDKGRYDLVAELSDGQTITKEQVGGFDKVEVVDNRMQASELENLLNNRDKNLGLGKNPKVVRKPVIKVDGSVDENDTQINLIDDIYGRLEFGSWSRVTVTSVEYDSQGRINKFTIIPEA